MRKCTSIPKTEKRPPRSKVASEVKSSIDEQAAAVIDRLKKRCCKGQQHKSLNWCVDIFARWHRDALYFVAIMQTPHGLPAKFEVRVARIEHVGQEKFKVAVPMRRGWNTIEQSRSPEECLKEIGDLIYL